jgi:hypothetical protein
MESHGEMIMTAENRRTRKILTHCRVFHSKYHIDWTGREPGPPRVATKRLSHGTAILFLNYSWNRKTTFVQNTFRTYKY